jgi:hypothetical protein
MCTTIWLLLAIGVSAPDPDITAAQFGEIMKAAHAAIRDVSFVYEGEMKWTGPAGQPGVENINVSFQGAYAFRSDGAEYIDVYIARENPKIPITRWNAALLKGNLEQMAWMPDEQGAGAPVRKSQGDQGSFGRTESPRDFFCVPFFASITDPIAYGYVFHGWESVDGRRCIVVELNPVPFPPKVAKQRLWHKYWIDVGRGAHPVKIESYRGLDRLGLYDHIKLVEVSPPGGDGPVWLPVSSECNGFRWNGREYPNPVIRVTQNVVAGSIAVNRGLPDRYFSLVHKGVTPRSLEHGTPRGELDELALKKEFDEHVKGLPERKPIHSQALAERLDGMLREADQQAKMLEASSSSRQGWVWTVLPSVVFAAFGATLLAAVWYRGWLRFGPPS